MPLLSDLTPKESVPSSSYSAITLHRSCPQAWMYQYLYGLEKPPEEDARIERKFGTMWHALRAADAIERGRALDSLKHEPTSIRYADDSPEMSTDRDLLVDGVLNAVDHWGAALSEEDQALWKDKIGELPGPRLRALNHAYLYEWSHEQENEQPLAVEVRWSRTIPGTAFTLVGYADEVYFDIRRNMTVVRDHKTSKNLSTQTAGDDMLDSQLHLYPWGLVPLVADWGVPPIQAVAYDRVRSVKPTTPRLTPKTRKLSAQITQYDLHTYQAFVADTEDYDEDPTVIEHLTSPAWRSVWFQRTRKPLNRNLMRAHLQAAADSMSDVQRTLERVARRGEATRNMTGSACRFCDFVKLCRAQMVGGIDGEYLVEEHGLRVAPYRPR